MTLDDFSQLFIRSHTRINEFHKITYYIKINQNHHKSCKVMLIL